MQMKIPISKTLEKLLRKASVSKESIIVSIKELNLIEEEIMEYLVTFIENQEEIRKSQVICYSNDQLTQDYGSCDGNVNELVIGKYYNVIKKEEHTWHTKVWLKGIEGSFNESLFKAEED
jgi:hypothetical protein